MTNSVKRRSYLIATKQLVIRASEFVIPSSLGPVALFELNKGEKGRHSSLIQRLQIDSAAGTSTGSGIVAAAVNLLPLKSTLPPCNNAFNT